jgi:ADP-ribose pyrophosphatase YjhB (NUDIX family)
MEIGETVADAAIREVREETGMAVEITGLVGIYTNPCHVMAYDDSEVRQQFSICFHAHPVGGQPREDGTETKAARWIDVATLDELNIHPSMRLRITDALAGLGSPRIT